MEWIQENGWSLITALLAVWALYVSKWQQKKLERTARRFDIANRLDQLLDDYHSSKEMYYTIESGAEKIKAAMVEFKEPMVNVIAETNKLGIDCTIMQHTLALLGEDDSMDSLFEKLKKSADRIENMVDSISEWKLTDASNKHISEKFLTKGENFVLDVIQIQKRFKFEQKMVKELVDTRLSLLSQAEELLSEQDRNFILYKELLGELDEPKIIIPNFFTSKK